VEDTFNAVSWHARLYKRAGKKEIADIENMIRELCRAYLNIL